MRVIELVGAVRVSEECWINVSVTWATLRRTRGERIVWFVNVGGGAIENALQDASFNLGYCFVRGESILNLVRIGLRISVSRGRRR